MMNMNKFLGDDLTDVSAGAKPLTMLCRTPLDVVKTQLQIAGNNTNTAHLGALQMIKMVYAREGVKGFWRGAVPRVANVALWGTCMVTTYEVLKRLCVRDDELESDTFKHSKH